MCNPVVLVILQVRNLQIHIVDNVLLFSMILSNSLASCECLLVSDVAVLHFLSKAVYEESFFLS